MLKQPDRESRNVNDFFYEMECRQIEKTARIRADQKGGYTHKSKRESEQYRTLLNKNKPSAFESEIHPSHKLRLCSVYFALPGAMLPIGR